MLRLSLSVLQQLFGTACIVCEMEQGLCISLVSIRLSVCLSVPFGRWFAAVGPVGRRYRLIAACLVPSVL